MPCTIFSYLKNHNNEFKCGAENEVRAGDGKLKIDCKGPNGNSSIPQTTAAIGAWFVDRYFDQLKGSSPVC